MANTPPTSDSNTERHQFKDFFGQPIKLGDKVLSSFVAYRTPQFALYEVIGFNPRTVKVIRLGTKKPKPAARSPENLYVVDKKLLTLRGLLK